jgi:hypothetical protein
VPEKKSSWVDEKAAQQKRLAAARKSRKDDRPKSEIRAEMLALAAASTIEVKMISPVRPLEHWEQAEIELKEKKEKAERGQAEMAALGKGKIVQEKVEKPPKLKKSSVSDS